jgi:DNA-binding CsgD family transcriptional regulator
VRERNRVLRWTELWPREVARTLEACREQLPAGADRIAINLTDAMGRLLSRVELFGPRFAPVALDRVGRLVPSLLDHVQAACWTAEAPVLEDCLNAMLERAPAAVVLDADGRLVRANEAGWALITSDATGHGTATLTDGSAFDVIPLSPGGDRSGPCLLVMDPLEASLRAAASWGLTRAEQRILRVLARSQRRTGYRQLARLLRCAEATLRRHMLHIRRKAGVSDNTALLNRLWAGQPRPEAAMAIPEMAARPTPGRDGKVRP